MLEKKSMDANTFVKEFQSFEDFLAPKLDTYEQAIYLYALRHSRLLGLDEIVIGFKSARKKLAFGIGKLGTPLSERACYDKLRSLKTKDVIDVLGTERGGTRIKVCLPSEIVNLIPQVSEKKALDIEEMNFFETSGLRMSLMAREGNKCFYCLRNINSSNYVIEHVVSRPGGNNSYRNLVAACRQCNNRKSNTSAGDFLRLMFREGLLNDSELKGRLAALEELRAGKRKPTIDSGRE